VSGPDLNHVANMKVAQAKIDAGDIRWYVTTANGYVVRGPFEKRSLAETNLKMIREWARLEAEGDPEN